MKAITKLKQKNNVDEVSREVDKMNTMSLSQAFFSLLWYHLTRGNNNELPVLGLSEFHENLVSFSLCYMFHTGQR